MKSSMPSTHPTRAVMYLQRTTELVPTLLIPPVAVRQINDYEKPSEDDEKKEPYTVDPHPQTLIFSILRLLELRYRLTRK